MPFPIRDYDGWKLATPPRLDDGPDDDEDEDDSDLDDADDDPERTPIHHDGDSTGGGPVAETVLCTPGEIRSALIEAINDEAFHPPAPDGDWRRGVWFLGTLAALVAPWVGLFWLVSISTGH